MAKQKEKEVIVKPRVSNQLTRDMGALVRLIDLVPDKTKESLGWDEKTLRIMTVVNTTINKGLDLGPRVAVMLLQMIDEIPEKVQKKSNWVEQDHEVLKRIKKTVEYDKELPKWAEEESSKQRFSYKSHESAVSSKDE